MTFRSKNHLLLTGMLAGSNSRHTVIHIHGTCGNYFSAGYIDTLARICNECDVNLLSINTSGHDGISEAYRGDEYVYVGGALSLFSEIVSDITGAIEFAREFSDKIALVGHSLGCDRVAFFSQQTSTRYPLVLVSPCDSYRLHEIYLRGASVSDHIARLRRVKPRDKYELLPVEEFGIRNKSEHYQIPIARDALLSIMDGPPFNLFRQDREPSFLLENPSLICIGGRDALQTSEPQKMFSFLSKCFPNSSCFLAPGGDHEFKTAEDELAQAIVTWATEIAFR